jgi:valyl-tRNA synthetase
VVLETAGFHFPDFSLGQAERPAVRPIAEISGSSPNPLYFERSEIKMSEKRRRDNTLTIRLTKSEKQRIDRNAKRAKRSITDYIVFLSLETPIHVAEDVKPLLIELKRIGNNLNQIATKINSGVFHSYDFQDIVDEQKKIYEQLLEIARKG